MPDFAPRPKRAARRTPSPRTAVLRSGSARVAAVLALWLPATGCGGGGDGAAASVASVRLHRYGVFRDLVWFAPRPDARVASARGFFLDRFEVTQGEWRVFRSSLGESPADTAAQIEFWSVGNVVDPAWPMTGITLEEARGFAGWRFGRLPRYDEWKIAATAYGRYLLPWGNLPRSAYANTEELRHGMMTPVGTFESGRQADGPYDLIGNAGEWTETLFVDWRAEPAQMRQTLPCPILVPDRVRAASRQPALSLWWRRGLPLPLWALVASDRRGVPHRLAAGSDRPILEQGFGAPGPFVRWPDERDSRVGMRVAADAAGLIDALRAEDDGPDARGEALLRSFLRREAEHLRQAWRAAKAVDRQVRPLDSILSAELDA